MDSNGKLDETVKNPKASLSHGASDLLNAINDSSITVNVSATNDINASDGISLRTGNFQGATYNADGTVDTKQDTKPSLLSKHDQANNKTIGNDMLHEVTESYKAGQIVQQTQTSVGPATSADASNPKSTYYKAHNGVVLASGNVLIQPTKMKNGYPQQINLYTGKNNSVLFYQYNFKF